MRWLAPLTLCAALSCGRAPVSDDFTLRIGVIGEIEPVTPESHSGGAAMATDLVFEALLRPEPGGWDSRFLGRRERLGPRQWRLELSLRARFSDGSPVTSDDVAESLRRRGVRVVAASRHDLVVEAEDAGPLETTLAFAVVARQVGGRFLGTGPFTVSDLLADRIVLTRVEPTPGRIARVELVACANGREALVRLLRRELGAVPSLDAAHAELLQGVPGLRIVRGSGPHALAILFSPRLPAAERRALAQAIPSAQIAAAIRREPCCGEDMQPRVLPPPGRPLRIGYPSSILFRRASLALRQGLGPRAGRVEPFSGADLATAGRVFDLVTTSMLVRPPGIASQYLRTGSAWNYTGYSNARYDAALEAGDEAEAAAALAEDPGFVIVARRDRVGAVDARLKNARFGEWGILETLPDWEVSP